VFSIKNHIKALNMGTGRSQLLDFDEWGLSLDGGTISQI